jgi:hypothetical protein
MSARVRIEGAELARFRAGPTGSAAPLATVVIPTKDRPEALAACVASYAANAERHGRSIRFVIADGGASPESRARNVDALAPLRARSAGGIHYFGHEEKRLLADALVRTGLDEAVVTFAIFGDGTFGTTTGANRNSLLLATIGEAFLTVDDDTVATPGADALLPKDLVCFDGIAPLDHRWYDDRALATRAAGLRDLDVVGAHAEFLGRTIADCARSADAAFTVDAAATAVDPAARVVFTHNGLYGDRCFPLSLPYLFLFVRGASLARLAESPDAYACALGSRETTRRVPCPAIGGHAYFATTYVGMDHRTFLPPFVPVGIGQDGLFGDTVTRVLPHGRSCHLPFALLHAPREVRSALSVLPKGTNEIPIQKMLQACLRDRAFALPGGVDDPERRLKLLGAHLQARASAGATDFAAWLLRCVRDEEDALADEHGAVLTELEAEGPRTPITAEWRTWLATRREALGSGEIAVRELVVRGHDPAAARAAAPRLVRSIGQVFAAWPDLCRETRAYVARVGALAERL